MVALDYNCELFMNAFGIEGILEGPWAWEMGQPPGSLALAESNGRRWIENRLTKTRPVVFHFPGTGKFAKRAPCFGDSRYTCLRQGKLEEFQILT